MECRKSFPSRRAELIAFLYGNQYDLIFLQETHFRRPRSFKSLVILPSARIGHLADKALFPLELITPLVVSSLLSTLTWPSLLFLSPLFLPRTPIQATSVLKFFFPTTLPYNSLTSTPLPSEALLLFLAPGRIFPIYSTFQCYLTPGHFNVIIEELLRYDCAAYIHHRHSGRIRSAILAESVARQKQAKNVIAFNRCCQP